MPSRNTASRWPSACAGRFDPTAPRPGASRARGFRDRHPGGSLPGSRGTAAPRAGPGGVDPRTSQPALVARLAVRVAGPSPSPRAPARGRLHPGRPARAACPVGPGPASRPPRLSPPPGARPGQRARQRDRPLVARQIEVQPPHPLLPPSIKSAKISASRFRFRAPALPTRPRPLNRTHFVGAPERLLLPLSDLVDNEFARRVFVSHSSRLVCRSRLLESVPTETPRKCSSQSASSRAASITRGETSRPQ